MWVGVEVRVRVSFGVTVTVRITVRVGVRVMVRVSKLLAPDLDQSKFRVISYLELE